jgi:hypothetical protein
MPNVIDFSVANARYAGHPNRIEFIREQILGMKRPDLIEVMRAVSARNVISTETLRNIEKKGGGSPASIARILEAINLELTKRGYDPVSHSVLMAPM